MKQLTREQRLTGAPNLPEDPIVLHAGALSVQFEHGVLRHIMFDKTPIIHQIYAAVRDQNWGTVDGTITNLDIDASDRSFEIRFQQQHVQGDIDFVWQARIKGTADNTIIFDFDGVANTTFKKNRIGFCVLHPMHCAGVPCRIEHINGEITESAFPIEIEPHQPFYDIRSITHTVTDTLKATVIMEGDTFEMEDQRNWTDASFKTYCTPLGIPFPVTVNAGDRVHQTITLKLDGQVPQVSTSDAGVTITLGQVTEKKIPPIGLTYASNAGALTSTALEHLKDLHLAHLRIDVNFANATWREVLERGLVACKQLDVTAEIALKFTENIEQELSTIRSLVDDTQVVRWLIFHNNEKSTSATTIATARRLLSSSAPLFGGTDAFFTELNRDRPAYEFMDGVSFSINPQVHAFDNASLIETLPVQASNVETTRTFVQDTPISVSPVTLKMRWNPNATAEEPVIPAGEYPPQADPRQMSLFAAGWTLGSVKYLAESNVHSLTYYETHGWLGVVSDDVQGEVECEFPAMEAGVPYPLYYVLADVAGLQGSSIVGCKSSEASQVIGLAVQSEQGLSVLLANLTHHKQTVTLAGIQPTMMMHIRDENGYQQNSLASTTVTLLPYAYARLDGGVV